MKIGILGVGVIGSAIIRGLCKDQDMEHNLYISPRGKEQSLILSETFSQVTRCQSNQEVLDQSDLVFISILPQNGLTILSELKFRRDHHVINLMSDKSLEDIANIIGPTASLTHLVPLSFIENRQGPIAMYPKHTFIEGFLSKLGQVISVDERDKIQAMAAITGLMTSYYKLMYDISVWGENNGLSADEAKAYTTSFFEALSHHGNHSDLSLLSNEMTPGGLNELALNTLNKQDVFKKWTDVLNPILNRLV